MAKKGESSQRWLREHFNDHYVNLAKREGYRSRAVYKLIEMDKKDRLFRPGQNVLELGAAPGGWTQYVVEKIGEKGRIIASDILPMDSFAHVEFIEGDFTQDDVLEKITKTLGDEGADLVISDMAPNVSGVEAVDQPRSMYLAELSLDLARQVLKPGGSLLVKVFHGAGFEEYVKELRTSFGVVKSRKPDASRSRSREVYLLAQRYNI